MVIISLSNSHSKAFLTWSGHDQFDQNSQELEAHLSELCPTFFSIFSVRGILEETARKDIGSAFKNKHFTMEINSFELLLMSMMYFILIHKLKEKTNHVDLRNFS